jgi:DNA-binding MarR family transcriptional regulator
LGSVTFAPIQVARFDARNRCRTKYVPEWKHLDERRGSVFMAERPTAESLGVWRELLTWHRGILDRLDADLMAAHGVTLEEYDVMVQLAEASRGRLGMGELSAATLIARSSCTRVVDRLVARRWVERVRDRTDRRRVVVGLTASGRGGLRRCAVTHLAGVHTAFSARLDARDLAALRRVLSHLVPAPEPEAQPR